MMQFTDTLQLFLQEKGFKRIRQEGTEGLPSRILWIREDEACLALVDIIPEAKPGQPVKPPAQLEEEMTDLVRKLTIRFNQRVERLTLMLCRDLPDKDQMLSTLDYPDIWWLDYKHGRVFLYEKQRTDFLGMKGQLEELCLRWQAEEAGRRRLEWTRIMQPVTVSLVLINILVFLLMILADRTGSGTFLLEHGAMTYDSILGKGEYYRLFTAMFIHFGADHLLQNMLILLLTGSRLERAVGRIPYLIIYLGAGLTASVTSVFITLRGSGGIAAGASGAIFGVMGGMLALLLKDALSRQKKYSVEIGLTGIIFMIVCAASYGFMSTGIDNAAHIGGLVGGFVITWLVTIRQGRDFIDSPSSDRT